MDRKLIELLICPVSQGKLKLDLENKVLISTAAGLVFPINDGIPILLESAAMKLEEWKSIKPDEARDHFARIAKENAEKSNAPADAEAKPKGEAQVKPKKTAAKKSALKTVKKVAQTAAKKTAKKTVKKTATKTAVRTTAKPVKKTAVKTTSKK